jgi:ADP-ribose pyrophosphatase YjhB (NUDIX family)
MESRRCHVHKLVADVCLTAESKVLMVRYEDTSGYDGEQGWFLPDDYLRHTEHPEQAARRIVADQTGLSADDLKLSHIESFEGNGYWHLIFHYAGMLAQATKPVAGHNVKAIEWFALNRLPEADEVAHGGWGLETVRTVLST